jgi:hypothetical protein
MTSKPPSVSGGKSARYESWLPEGGGVKRQIVIIDDDG